MINQEEIEASLEQRADYIPIDKLVSETAGGSQLFKTAQKALLNSSLRTIVGPRGCGKTHLMRYAWQQCKDELTKPFAVYASFNRYYRLEPLLVSRASPPHEFHAWALGVIAVAALYSFEAFYPQGNFSEKNNDNLFFVERATLEDLISSLEKNRPLTEDQDLVADKLSINLVKKLIDTCCNRLDRKRTVLFLDDAALTLTPVYMSEILDILSALKSSTIAPKASVYPGTTEYSSKFHIGQDAMSISVWPSVESEDYATDMDDIAKNRIADFEQMPNEAVTLIRFAAFGVSRAYLTMLFEFKEIRKSKNVQQAVNSVIESHSKARIAEYRSLGQKVPKFTSLISVGDAVLQGMVSEIKIANANNSHLLQKIVGIDSVGITPIVKRMLQLLIEAGLIYDIGEVKHGTPQRIYQRYVPHGALLLRNRAIVAGDSGGALKALSEALSKKAQKHPVRRQINRLVADATQIDELKFSLPPCQKCNSPRLSETQRFCAGCGSQLIESSTFEACLNIEIVEVPGLTEWQLTKIKAELSILKTIRDYLAMQDPVSELFSVYGFGPRRSAKIADILQSFVDDYLS